MFDAERPLQHGPGRAKSRRANEIDPM